MKIKFLKIIGLRGLLFAISGKVTHTTALIKISRNDCKHPFWLRVPSSDVPTYDQVFIKEEYRFLVESPPEIIVDAGANIGLASIYFANKYPDAKIIALEPEQSNFELLKKNVSPYRNIVPVQSALWDKNEKINLVDPGLGEWGFRTEVKNSAENPREKICHQVTAMTVDRIIKEFNLEKIDILKIDIEGAEREVFTDTSAWIEKVSSLIVELHERFRPGCNRSFYCGSNGFDKEWRRGENVYLSKGNYLTAS